MFVIDTNVLVYAVNTSCPEYEQCRTLVEDSRRGPGPWYITWSLIYEFLRVVTHSRVFRQPITLQRAWEFVDTLLASPGLQVLVQGPRHAEVAALTIRETPGLKGNLLHDAHTANLMREHGVRRIYTRDTDFHRFPFLEVVDPLTP